MEPEKHWGLFTVGREPKQVMKPLYPDLLQQRATGQGDCGPAAKPFAPLD
jgi:hypothetical protein